MNASYNADFCLLQMLTDGLEWCGLLWCFLSDSHSDGTHSLQSIHCWDTDAVTHIYKPDEETISILILGGPEAFVFLGNYSLKMHAEN